MRGDWEQALGEYLPWLEVRGYAPRTGVQRAWIARRLQAFLGLDLAAVKREHLTAFLAHQQTHILARTAAKELINLRPFLRWAARRGFLLVDPCLGLELPPVVHPPTVALTPAQVRRLLKANDPSTARGLRDLALLETLYGTGLRHQELCALQLTDYDRQERQLLVRPGKSRERLNPVGEHLAQVLADYLERSRNQLARPETTALFVSDRGFSVHYDVLTELVRRAAQRAGLKGVYPHALRRAFATHMLRNGAELGAVKALLGHRCWKATEFYTYLLPFDLVEEYRRTHPRALARPHAP